ncbi:Aromatic di-alanine and TPR containing protein [Ceratobasidium theobromae]|uniref:Aromatic di-alanine and TPR containing protein n=1 Tax=Ceratobasidium theobromae TaxID=1582974 RepID=A0A5N5Q8A9_9AGAM|nr:Aromatic di-alanine and TPR containing protein [Ceratobasidium theobromae]
MPAKSENSTGFNKGMAQDPRSSISTKSPTASSRRQPVQSGPVGPNPPSGSSTPRPAGAKASMRSNKSKADQKDLGKSTSGIEEKVDDAWLKKMVGVIDGTLKKIRNDTTTEGLKAADRTLKMLKRCNRAGGVDFVDIMSQQARISESNRDTSLCWSELVISCLDEMLRILCPGLARERKGLTLTSRPSDIENNLKPLDEHVGHPTKLSTWIVALGPAYEVKYRETLPEDEKNKFLARARIYFSHVGSSIWVGSWAGPGERIKSYLRLANLELPGPNTPRLQMIIYRKALELANESLGITMPDYQHSNTLQELKSLAEDPVLCALKLGDLVAAVEMISHSQGIYYQIGLRLAKLIHRLLDKGEAGLAKNLRRVSNELKAMNALPAEKLDAQVSHYKQLLQKYHTLLEQALKVEGCSDLMKPESWDVLRGAVRNKRIIIPFFNKQLCVAPVLNPGTPEPLRIDLNQKAFPAIKQSLIFLYGSEGPGREKSRYTKAARHINRRVPSRITSIDQALSEMWANVVGPIFEKLDLQKKSASNVDELEQVIWCGVETMFIPFHGAGIYEASGAKASDYVVSSYAPTLTTLLTPAAGPVAQRKHNKILVIAVENSPIGIGLSNTKNELKIIKGHASSLNWQLESRLDNDATTDNVMQSLQNSQWVHWASHATQGTMDLTKTGFGMSDGLLSLDRVFTIPYATRGMAFLSACQTAQRDPNLPYECDNLASGMIRAGFPDVIATMWSIMDGDAPVIADKVYAQLHNMGGETMDHKDSAKALHVATAKLRDQIGEKTFSRWLPFIHIGV